MRVGFVMVMAMMMVVTGARGEGGGRVLARAKSDGRGALRSASRRIVFQVELRSCRNSLTTQHPLHGHLDARIPGAHSGGNGCNFWRLRPLSVAGQMPDRRATAAVRTIRQTPPPTNPLTFLQLLEGRFRRPPRLQGRSP